MNSNAFSTEENVNNKFSIKVMDELQDIYTTALDDIKSGSSISIHNKSSKQKNVSKTISENKSEHDEILVEVDGK
jgi:hypothetical protein